jgi:transposase, IS30 family
MCERIRKDRWSIDGCVGAARLMKSFPGRTIPCTKTLYNMLWANKLPLSLFDLPHALGRKKHRKWNRKNKRMLGRSIEERPAIAAAGTEIGHWEVDTVVGRRQGREAVIFTAVEKVLREFIAIRVPGRTSAGVEVAMTKLREEFGDEKFSKVFKTMTADNGPEFETFSQYEQLGTKIYFTHPYSSWERPQNERHNGLLRDYIPKGTSIECYSDEDVLSIADELNQRPRRILGYHTPAELFDHFLDEVYAIEKCS